MKIKLSVLIISFGIIGLVGMFLVYLKIKEAPAFQQNSVTATTPRTITVAELSQHNSEKSCFVAYKGEVFDISWFIPQHEGGMQIVSLCGQEADTFSQQHPGGSFDKPKIQAILKVSKVGTLVKN